MPRGMNARISRATLRKSARGKKIGQKDPHNSNKTGRDAPSKGKKYLEDLCGSLKERDLKVITLLRTLAETNYHNNNTEIIDRIMIQNQHIPLLRKINACSEEGRIKRAKI